MINQLFKNLPNIILLRDILNAFGFTNFNENIKFTYHRLEYYNTIEKLTLLKPRLQELYLDCKSYYTIIKKNIHAITLLRQICRLFNYSLVSSNLRQIRTYSIIKKKNNVIKKDIIIKFD